MRAETCRSILVRFPDRLGCSWGNDRGHAAYGPQLGDRLGLSHAEQSLIGLSGNSTIPYTRLPCIPGSPSLAVGVCGSAPFVGRVIDSRGPRITLALSFVLLFAGYAGIRGVYDGSEDNSGPAGGGALLSLIFFELLTGIGGWSGYATALNTVARSFPNRIVGIAS